METNKIHIWSKEEKEYLKEITPGHHHREIKEMMNKKFDSNFSVKQIKNAINRYKLNTGLTGQFKKGHTPFNKGTKGLNLGGKETQFKKGNIPPNYLPIGTERVNSDGYVDIKIEDPNKWKQKHILIWEKYNGPVPDGYVVLFADSNKRNFNINNLILVSRKQLLILNKNKLIKKDAELTRVGINIANIYEKISERKEK